MKNIKTTLKEKGINCVTFEESLKKSLEKTDFIIEWDKNLPRYQFVCELLRIRNAKGITQRELAALIDMEQPTLARIEQGDGSLHISTMQKIAEGLGKKLRITFE